MCNTKDGCLQPEKGKGDPRDCSPEQIKECHGEVRKHPCGTGGSKVSKTAAKERPRKRK